MGYPHPDPEPFTGVSPRKDMRPVEVLWDGDGVPPEKDMGPVEVLWDGDGNRVPLGSGQTENITSCLVLCTQSVIIPTNGILQKLHLIPLYIMH